MGGFGWVWRLDVDSSASRRRNHAGLLSVHNCNPWARGIVVGVRTLYQRNLGACLAKCSFFFNQPAPRWFGQWFVNVLVPSRNLKYTNVGARCGENLEVSCGLASICAENRKRNVLQSFRSSMRWSGTCLHRASPISISAAVGWFHRNHPEWVSPEP